MPIVMMAFLQGTGRAALRGAGYLDASGAEVVVPGMAVLFAFFGVAFIGTAFFAEHDWHTWDRLRASQADSLEIVLGKIVPSALLMSAQLVVMFVAGVVLFGLRIHGSVAGLGLMMLASIAVLVALSMLFTAVFRTVNQMMAVVNLAAMVLAGIGGALAPVEVLPDWARFIAPLSPAYWMLDGFRNVVLQDGDLGSTFVPAAATLVLAAMAAAIAAWKLRLSDEKVWDQ